MFWAGLGLEEARGPINMKNCMVSSEAGETGGDHAKKFGFHPKSNVHFKKGEVTQSD